ncbi:MAG: hypothetical protein ACI33K_13930 [Clostridiaceae bacterium]
MLNQLVIILGWLALFFIIITAIYHLLDLTIKGKLYDFLYKFHKVIEGLAITCGFIHGYYMAYEGGLISGYFAWLILAWLLISELFFKPKTPGPKWLGYITALIVMLVLFALFHVYSALIGEPVIKIIDMIHTV